MKGSMRRRGSAWELRVYLGADPVSGKQRYATRTVRAGKRGAHRVLNEMIALRWPDIDLERGVMTISRGLVQGLDGLVEKDTKTHQTRRVAIDVPTTAALTEH